MTTGCRIMIVFSSSLPPSHLTRASLRITTRRFGTLSAASRRVPPEAVAAAIVLDCGNRLVRRWSLLSNGGRGPWLAPRRHLLPQRTIPVEQGNATECWLLSRFLFGGGSLPLHLGLDLAPMSCDARASSISQRVSLRNRLCVHISLRACVN